MSLFKSMLGLNVLLLAACVTTSAPDRDLVLAQNLEKMQQRPGSIELEWRQPKRGIAGMQSANTPVVADGFPAPDALNAAHAYSVQSQGLGFMAWHDGQIVAARFADNVTAQTPFASYSMHKSILAIALMAAVEDGYIASIDDPVGRYISAWQRDARGAITLRQLLTHSSGLAYFPVSSPEAMEINFSGRMRDAALGYPLSDEPGKSFQYNNVNSLVLGIALQSALFERDLEYADYLSQRVWRPLGNGDAALWVDSLETDGVARFHSGLEAGLSDWLNVGVMLVNDGVAANGARVLSAASVETLRTASSVNPAYGLHVWLGKPWQAQRSYGPASQLGVVHSAPYLADDVWFFDGFGGQRVYIVPSAHLVVARFGEVNFQYDDAMIINLLLRGLGDVGQEDPMP